MSDGRSVARKFAQAAEISIELHQSGVRARKEDSYILAVARSSVYQKTLYDDARDS